MIVVGVFFTTHGINFYQYFILRFAARGAPTDGYLSCPLLGDITYPPLADEMLAITLPEELHGHIFNVRFTDVMYHRVYLYRGAGRHLFGSKGDVSGRDS